MYNENEEGLRGNPNLVVAGHKEYIPADVLSERIQEFKKILEDPIYFAEKYFYIINGDNGKQLIKVYPKQAEMIKSMCENQRSISLACRQCRQMC